MASASSSGWGGTGGASSVTRPGPRGPRGAAEPRPQPRSRAVPPATGARARQRRGYGYGVREEPGRQGRSRDGSGWGRGPGSAPLGPTQGPDELGNPDPALVTGPGAETAAHRLDRSRGRRGGASQLTAAAGTVPGSGGRVGARGPEQSPGGGRYDGDADVPARLTRPPPSGAGPAVGVGAEPDPRRHALGCPGATGAFTVLTKATDSKLSRRPGAGQTPQSSQTLSLPKTLTGRELPGGHTVPTNHPDTPRCALLGVPGPELPLGSGSSVPSSPSVWRASSLSPLPPSLLRQGLHGGFSSAGGVYTLCRNGGIRRWQSTVPS